MADAMVDAMPDAPPSLSITLEQAAITAPPGIGVELDVTVTRGNFDGPVELHVASPVANTIADLGGTIPAGATSTTLRLRVTSLVQDGTFNLVVSASAFAATLTSEAPLALTVDATAPAFGVHWSDSTSQAHAGGVQRKVWTSPGLTTDVPLYLAPIRGWTAPVALTWEGLPAGLTANALSEVPDTKAAVQITLTAADTATVGDSAGFIHVTDGTLWERIDADLSVTTPNLDTTLGAAGRVVSDATAPFRAAAIDVDSAGKPVVIGSGAGGALAARRYTTTGVLDTTFGSGGESTGGATGWIPVDGAVIGDLTYVLAREENQLQMAIARFTATGVADSTWGTGGLLVVNAGQEVYIPRRFRIRGNGTIYITGLFADPDAGTYPKVICLTSTGGDCPTYGTNGIATLAVPGVRIHSLRFDSQSRVVVAGGANTGVIVARFTTTGVLDDTFGTDGVATLDIPSSVGGGYPEARDLDIDPMDRIVITGYASHNGGAFVARVTAAGLLDTTFSGDGHDEVELDDFDLLFMTRVRVTANAITLFGNRTETTSTPQRAFVVRYTPTGVLDQTFAHAGNDWLLGGTHDAETFAGYRAVAGTFWLVTQVGFAQTVLMKHTGM